jgi:mycothiol synthase
VCAGNPSLPNQADSLILETVRALSNFLRKLDGPVSPGGPEFRPVRPEEVHDALALILACEGTPGNDDQIRDFMQFMSHRRIGPNELWVAKLDGRLAWAVLPIVSPGRTMLLLGPRFLPETSDVGPLIESICDHWHARDVHLAQALLEPADAAARRLYAAHGFREMAELLYLEEVIPPALEQPRLPEGFAWKTYSTGAHRQFAQTVLESYQHSMDCPSLNGVREIEDIMAGHRASGEFNPQFWFLLTDHEVACGVVLLSRVSRAENAELVYLGLVPAARGRGIADLLMRQALCASRQMNLGRLTLAVDALNAPALKLYFRHGMQRVGSKIALMRDLRTRV